MSSTNRGGQRHVSDYYVTPVESIVSFLHEFDACIPNFLSRDIEILDPCAGGDLLHEMSYPKALNSIGIPYKNIFTIDIREDSDADTKGDYLTTIMPKKFDLTITNPPFSHALPIIKKALQDTKVGGYVVMLLRLNFFGSQIRFPFWQEYLPSYCFVHHIRMSFTDTRGTDSIEYMHAVWKVGDKVDFTKLKVI